MSFTLKSSSTIAIASESCARIPFKNTQGNSTFFVARRQTGFPWQAWPGIFKAAPGTGYESQLGWLLGWCMSGTGHTQSHLRRRGGE